MSIVIYLDKTTLLNKQDPWYFKMCISISFIIIIIQQRLVFPDRD